MNGAGERNIDEGRERAFLSMAHSRTWKTAHGAGPMHREQWREEPGRKRSSQNLRLLKRRELGKLQNANEICALLLFLGLKKQQQHWDFFFFFTLCCLESELSEPEGKMETDKK